MKTGGFFTALALLPCTVIFAQELIQDAAFQNGFYVRNVTTLDYEGPITCTTGLPDPVWNLAEWGSASSVLDITPVTVPSGFCSWADPNKDFRFGPLASEAYQLYFAVNSDQEYSGIYRQNGEPWPHLLVEQRISPPFPFPGQTGAGCPPLSQLSALNLKLDGKLLYNQTIMESGYSASLHAAQFQLFFTVQNLNTASSGFGQYVWLGVSLYDDRRPVTPGNVSYDIGTSTLINMVPYTAHASETTHNGNWVHNEVDLLPYALQALDTAWNNGFLNGSMDLADYRIGGMNMGWELPGRNISTFVVKDLSLEAVSTITGMDENRDMNVEIYPNPTTDDITIKWDAGQLPTKVELFDLLGREVGQKNTFTAGNQCQLSVAALPAGTYICQIAFAQHSIFRKVVVE